MLWEKRITGVFITPTHLNLDLHMTWDHPSTSGACQELNLQPRTYKGLNRLPTTKVPHEVVTISTIVTQVFSLNLSLKFVQRVSLVTRIPVWDPLRAVEMSWPMFSHTNKNKREKILWPINWALLNSFVLGYIVLLLL